MCIPQAVNCPLLHGVFDRCALAFERTVNQNILVMSANDVATIKAAATIKISFKEWRRAGIEQGNGMERDKLVQKLKRLLNGPKNAR